MYLSATGVSGVQPHQVMVPEVPEGPEVAEVVSSVEPPPPEHAASASEAAATAASAAALRVRSSHSQVGHGVPSLEWAHVVVGASVGKSTCVCSQTPRIFG